MKKYPVIIVGGGPAGSSCAQKLNQAGIDCLVVDKQSFPRQKICAGWITPEVFRDLNALPEDYPFGLTSFPNLKIYVYGFPITLPGKQYAIRRVEFDHWLLERSGAEFLQHQVKNITRTEDGFVLDNELQAEILVGAGGTHCPVYRTFWGEQHPRTGSRIVALETEYAANWDDPVCKLWFFENKLPGYAWYVPKTGGYLNIGIGGNAAVLKEQENSIQDHWQALVKKLKRLSLIQDDIPDPKGHVYYLRSKTPLPAVDNLFLAGDAVGLATLDMGEGIGPAIRSGQGIADQILGNHSRADRRISRYSFLPPGLRWLAGR